MPAGYSEPTNTIRGTGSNLGDELADRLLSLGALQ